MDYIKGPKNPMECSRRSLPGVFYFFCVEVRFSGVEDQIIFGRGLHLRSPLVLLLLVEKIKPFLSDHLHSEFKHACVIACPVVKETRCRDRNDRVND